MNYQELTEYIEQCCHEPEAVLNALDVAIEEPTTEHILEACTEFWIENKGFNTQAEHFTTELTDYIEGMNEVTS
jgi:hypothetical protein